MYIHIVVYSLGFCVDGMTAPLGLARYYTRIYKHMHTYIYIFMHRRWVQCGWHCYSIGLRTVLCTHMQTYTYIYIYMCIHVQALGSVLVALLLYWASRSITVRRLGRVFFSFFQGRGGGGAPSGGEGGRGVEGSKLWGPVFVVVAFLVCFIVAL